jgi:hemerythrin-like domain-containing protein
MVTSGPAAAADPYEILAREHRLIERVLGALGRLCAQSLGAGRLDERAARLALRFLREFADRTHHLKEERLLFPAIEANGYFPGCGLAQEHEDGRERVRGMGDAVAAAASGDPEAVRLFARQARSYIGFLREHIQKEDDCLADVTASTLSSEARVRLTAQFDELERQEIGERAFERYTALAEEIEALCASSAKPSSTGAAG